MRSQSRHSRRTVPTKGSVIAFAFGARTGVLMTRNAFAGEDGVEVRGELAVAVANQKPKPFGLLLRCRGELTRLLCSAGAGRVGGAAGEVDAAASELDEEEDVEALQQDRLDGEEIDGEHALSLVPHKDPPAESAAVAGRPETGVAEDFPNSGRRHVQAESVDLADDALIAPARVRLEQAEAPTRESQYRRKDERVGRGRSSGERRVACASTEASSASPPDTLQRERGSSRLAAANNVRSAAASAGRSRRRRAGDRVPARLPTHGQNGP
jgi:hypothetical protein